jgi:hypothetical protein
MLAAVLMMFFVFTFSGVAMLELSGHTALKNQDAVQVLKNQYAVESAVNVALWRINTVSDSSGNFIDGDVVSQYDSTSKELVVTIDRYQKQNGVTVSLKEDTHFNHALSAMNGIIYNGFTLTAQTEVREFDFLPESDLSYFYNNAVEVHTESNHTYLSLVNGIHIFLGDNITLKNVSFNGTAVFMGVGVEFSHNVNIIAANDDPAMVFTDPLNEFSFYEDIQADDYLINGPIYSEGKINLRDGEISGPVMANTIELKSNVDLTDEVSPQFYKWTDGFGNQEDYHNPVSIKKWHKHKNTTS